LESLRFNVEGERGVHLFRRDESVGVMMPEDFTSINSSLIRRVITNYKGFALAIVSLPPVSI